MGEPGDLLRRRESHSPSMVNGMTHKWEGRQPKFSIYSTIGIGIAAPSLIRNKSSDVHTTLINALLIETDDAPNKVFSSVIIHGCFIQAHPRESPRPKEKKYVYIFGGSGHSNSQLEGHFPNSSRTSLMIQKKKKKSMYTRWSIHRCKTCGTSHAVTSQTKRYAYNTTN